VSDQTIPNVQLINEYKEFVECYLFITTKSKKNRAEWIIKASQIKESCIRDLEVNEFSFDDIENQLDTFPFDEYERIMLNLTGGTKVMVLATYEYFKELGAEIYYLTGNENRYIKLAPGRKKNDIDIQNEMDVLFIYNDKLYTIECKTSIYYTSNIDGKIEKSNILKETIFKSDSLKQGFGLFVNTSIFTLDELHPNMNLERANLSNIMILDRKSITTCNKMKDLLKI
jgi:hypothetical protein